MSSSDNERMEKLAALRGFSTGAATGSASKLDVSQEKGSQSKPTTTPQTNNNPSTPPEKKLSHYQLCTDFIKGFKQFIKEDGVHADNTNYKKLSLLNSAMEINLSQIWDATILLAIVELNEGPEVLSELAQKIVRTDPDSPEYKAAATQIIQDDKEYETINKFLNKIYKHSCAYIAEHDKAK